MIKKISAILLLILSIKCTHTPVTPENKPDITLRYTVDIPQMNMDSLRISLSINAWHDNDSLRFVAPPVYADNPQLIPTGINFCLLSVGNSNSEPVSYSTDSVIIGKYRYFSIGIASDQCPVELMYYVKFDYTADSVYWFMPVPFVGEKTGYLQGNYMFLFPYEKNGATVDLWREQFPVSVTYNIGQGVSLFGDPADTAFFSTPYQLMFSTSALLSSSLTNSQCLFSGTAFGQTYRCVNISPDKSFKSNVVERAESIFDKILQDIIPEFGNIGDKPLTIITGINPVIGLEGMFAFCCKDFPDNDETGTLAIQMAHELIHAWIGLRIGDYQDPWWKEGTANYLGLQIASGNNLSTLTILKETLLDSNVADGNILSYALSDETIRESLLSESGLGRYVYRKGSQVNMLIDRRLRDNTGNNESLKSVIGKFAAIFNNRAFYRNEYVDFLNKNGNCDVSDIFRLYVDAPGLIPAEILQDNYDALLALGAFGSRLP